MSESKVIWHSIEKEGLPPDDCDAVLVSVQNLIREKSEVLEAVWNGQCWTDAYEGNPWFFMAAGSYLIVGLIAEDGQKTIYVARQYYEIVNIPGEGWLREPDAERVF